MFTGNTAPFHIYQPSTDYDVQTVSPNAAMVTVSCSLNITIPNSVVVMWTLDNEELADNRFKNIGNTTALQIINFQLSDAGDYRCIFDDAFGTGWTLTRNIILLIPCR